MSEIKTATLIEPIKSYSKLELVKFQYTWTVRLQNGLEIEVREDEFILD